MDANFELADAVEQLNDSSNIELQHERDVTSEDVDRLLEEAVEAVAESSDSITNPEIFGTYCSLLKSSESVSGAVMNKLLDSISSGLQSEFESTVLDINAGEDYQRHKMPLEMYAFLLQWFVMAAEKARPLDGEAISAPAPKPKRGRGGRGGGRGGRSAASRKEAEQWSWIDQIPATLALVSKGLAKLQAATLRIWTTSTERETFISCLTRPAYQVAENETYMKSQEIRNNVYQVICRAVKHQSHGPTAQILIMQRLQYYDFLGEAMAECLALLATTYDHSQLGDEILREISQKTFSANDNKVTKTFAKFLTTYSERAPRSALKQMSLLLEQLDSESYTIRIAIVEIMGSIISDLSSTLSADVTDDSVDPKKLEKEIKGLYEHLLDRMLDVVAHVRTKVLNVCSKLCDAKLKFPKQRLAMTNAAIAALEDKSPLVRKPALSLLIKLILTHPWGMVQGGMLEIDVFQKQYEEIKAELQKIQDQMIPKEAEAGGGEEEEEGERKKKKKKKRNDDDMDVDVNETQEDTDEEDEDEEDEEEEEEQEEDDDTMAVDDEDGERSPKPKKKKKSKLKPRQSQLDISAINEQPIDTRQHAFLTLRKRYYSEALQFIRSVEESMEHISTLLGSKNRPEVLESIEFFRVAYEYKFASAEIGLKKMIHLIWSKDNSTTSEDGNVLKGIRSRLLECYRSLYFEAVPDLEPKAQVSRIAKNMVNLTYDATLAELTSLEEMMRIMMEEDHIHRDVINKLWQVFSADRLLPKTQRRGAIIILGMLASAKRSVLTDKVDTMLKVGLGALGKADLTLARYTCVALQRLNGSAKKVKGSLQDKTIRIEMDNNIFRKLRTAIERPCRSKDWFGLAEQAINTIYALGDHPDLLCDEIIRTLTKRVFTKKPTSSSKEQGSQDESQGQTASDPDAMDEDQPAEGNDEGQGQTQAQASGEENDQCDAFELSQLLFVVGHVAIKQIVYLELAEREMKRQKDERQAAEKLAKGPQPAQKDGEELDQVAGNAEDEIADRISETRENELLFGEHSLLKIFGPMLVSIISSPKKFKNPTLRAAAMLSLSKFLCVSSKFCEQHHWLLFKVLETSKSANIRSNIAIALGDVAVSFSTIIDENSNELYKGLTDPDPGVKKNTLMVLTHLILNGMVKVKGQLGEMAKCLEDEDPRIADLAKLFFSELATKDNAIYNNLPDIISHLSTGDHAVDEETFQRTLKYIFTFIEKEKQAENIVEKLCQRFRLSEDPRQWRDIAFCLALLPYKSEKSIKKLTEGMPFYRDKLHDKGVYDKFGEILGKARQNRFAKDLTTELNDFEEILEEHKRQGEDDQALEKRAQGKKAAAKKRAARKNTRTKKVKVEREDEDEDDE
ncbi:condensin complex non-SMC subunit Cnd1 [Stygiomarasmius scandens]|uniref:Condensin complex subunit 1 n=1 Tax=Marasmiellus scandens TaxID=2682957 RepID=A0ABR1IM34_9AGAR